MGLEDRVSIEDLYADTESRCLRACDRGFTYLTALIIVFIANVIAMIALGATIVFISSSFTSVEEVRVYSAEAVLSTLYVLCVVEAIGMVYLVRFMLSMVYAVRSYLFILWRLGLLETVFPRGKRPYPLRKLIALPYRLSVLVVFRIIGLAIVVYYATYGFFYGNMDYVKYALEVLAFVFIVTLLVMYLVYRFYSSLTEYFNVSLGSGLGVIAAILLIVTTIKYFLGLVIVTNIAEVVVYILYIILLKMLLEDLSVKIEGVLHRLSIAVREVGSSQ